MAYYDTPPDEYENECPMCGINNPDDYHICNPSVLKEEILKLREDNEQLSTSNSLLRAALSVQEDSHELSTIDDECRVAEKVDATNEVKLRASSRQRKPMQGANPCPSTHPTVQGDK